MGITVSCFRGGGLIGLRRKIEDGDCAAVLACVREWPGLLVAPYFSGKNTIFHVVSRYGQTAILTALLQLVDELLLSASSPVQPQPKGTPDTQLHGTHNLERHWTTDSAFKEELGQGRKGPKPKALKRGMGRGHGPQARVPLVGCGSELMRLELLPSKRELVNMLNSKHQSPLMIAATRGHADMVQILLQLGADPHCADKTDGCTALHYTAMYGQVECARALLASAAALSNLESRPPPRGGDEGPHTSEQQGVEAGSGRADAVQPVQLTRRGTRSVPRLANMMSHAGATALHFAADGGHVELVRLLCAHGADINAQMCPTRFLWLMLHHGATPLHLAAEQGHLPVSLALLRHYYQLESQAAQTNSPTPVTDPRVMQDRAGLRPHQLAFLTHHFRVALVIRPGYPLRWLFDPPPSRTSIPSLAAIAAKALRQHLCTEIDLLEEAQTAAAAAAAAAVPLRHPAAAAASGKPPLYSAVGVAGPGRTNSAVFGGGIRTPSMGLSMGMGLDSAVSTPRRGAWTHAAAGPAVSAGMGTMTAPGEGLDTAFRLPASEIEADPQSIREAAGLAPATRRIPPGATAAVAAPAGAVLVPTAGQDTAVMQPERSASQQAVPPLRLLASSSSSAVTLLPPGATAIIDTDIHTARAVELQGLQECDGVVQESIVEELAPCSIPSSHTTGQLGLGSSHFSRQSQSCRPSGSLRAATAATSVVDDSLRSLNPALSHGQEGHSRHGRSSKQIPSTSCTTPPEGLRETVSGGFCAEDHDDEDVCDVCFEEGPRVRLRPCCHEMCLRCARQVCNSMVAAPAACPFCRGSIAGFKGGTVSSRPSAAVEGALAPNSMPPCLA